MKGTDSHDYKFSLAVIRIMPACPLTCGTGSWRQCLLVEIGSPGQSTRRPHGLRCEPAAAHEPPELQRLGSGLSCLSRDDIVGWGPSASRSPNGCVDRPVRVLSDGGSGSGRHAPAPTTARSPCPTRLRRSVSHGVSRGDGRAAEPLLEVRFVQTQRVHQMRSRSGRASCIKRPQAKRFRDTLRDSRRGRIRVPMAGRHSTGSVLSARWSGKKCAGRQYERFARRRSGRR
jgi:hypothetical protein